MKRSLGVLLSLTLVAQPVWAEQALPITRLLLSRNGMAYVVRSGEISAPISLTFHPEDMNDILKSFTAWNPQDGSLYSVGYTTGVPSSHALKRFPFDVRGDIGLAGFLTQVKGAAVRLMIGEKAIEGKLLAVQQAEHVVQQQTAASDHRLTVLLKDSSLETVWLSEVRSVQFPDAALREQMQQYMDVLSAGRQDVTREVSIYPGAASGQVRAAYLQQFPLWKTSYRVDLGATDGRLQGWAQIDNPTGESWENVQVSLLSGTPVSFVMNLYDPLYTQRATVAVPGGQVAAPRQYQSAVRVEVDKNQLMKQSTQNAGIVLDESQITGLPLYGNDPLALISSLPGYRTSASGREYDTVGGLPPSMTSTRDGSAAAAGRFAEANAVQVRDFFEYTFPFPVRLASRQSALLPFVQKTLPMEHVSIFNSRVDRGNARLGVRVNNDSDVPYEPGPITFFENGRYVGEAVIDYLPRSEKRLVSYGVDNDVQIAVKAEAMPQVRTRLTVARGVAVFQTEALQMTNYEVRNKALESKTLVVEHPRTGDRKLKEIDPWETSESFYRFRKSLAAGESAVLSVPEVLFSATQVSLRSVTRDQLTAMFSGPETPPEIREKLGEIIAMQEKAVELKAAIASTKAGVDTLFVDQERVRQNLVALRDSGEERELRSRYLANLLAQESSIEAGRMKAEALAMELATVESRLADLIANLTWK